MIRYGKKSQANIETLCSALQRTLYAYADMAPDELDLSIICGHRDESKQNAAYDSGASKVRWPNSKHNAQPSRAFDFVPYPRLDWNDGSRFARIAGALQLAAATVGVKLRWGGDWDADGATIDENFHDLGHIEVAE